MSDEDYLMNDYIMDDDIPSLDDIIPWKAKPRQPRQPEVFDAVRTTHGINVVFIENVLKSYFKREGIDRDVKVESLTETPMELLNASQRNTVVQVNVNIAADGEIERQTHHMVVKTLTASQPVRALSVLYYFDRREFGLYTQIFDDLTTFQKQEAATPDDYLQLPIPKCFFARYTIPGEDTDIEQEEYTIPSDESVVVLENVKCLGFTHTVIDEGLSREQVLMVTEGIARLHGLTLAMKERSGIPLQRSYPYLLCWREAIKCIVKLFDRNVPDIVKLLTTFGAGNLSNKLMELRPNLEDLLEVLARPEEPISVLGHLNLWAHNILFKEEECIIVDWQMITCARPTFDLAFLLASSVKANVRRRNTTQFLDHYYEHFTTYAQRFGLNVQDDLEYTRENLQQEFRYSQLLAMFFCIAKSRDIITTRDTELQFIDYLNDLDEQNLLDPDAIDTDTPEYIYWMPRNPSRSNVVFRIERRPSMEDVDHICGLYPVYELPED